MGSDSDLPVMKDAARILNMFGVPYEVSYIILFLFRAIHQHWTLFLPFILIAFFILFFTFSRSLLIIFDLHR